MRPAVKKPAAQIHHQTKKEKTDNVRLGAPKQERIKRAKQVEKSPKISRFNVLASKSAATPKVPMRNDKLEVKEPPKHRPAPQPAEKSWPVVDQFEKAVHSASSHLEEFANEATRSKKNRKFAYSLVSLAVLAVIGFGAYQAVPMVQVKMAGNKAGFSPSLPSYSPAGFGLNSPAASSGEVTLSYKSRTDDKGFKITQEPSEWNSESLLHNFLTPANKEYKTVQSNGKTIYTYDKSNATWVDSGIWFKLESNADLSSEQLIKIADGL